MRNPSVFTLLLLCLVAGSFGKRGFGPGEQEWNYVRVRPHANMFWWLYYTTANVNSYYERPLIIWLQGGPGGSSTGYGNFEELGPLDVSLNPRNHTWVKDYNVLFIDNPVGTGFSYVQTPSAYARTNRQIADDLVECMRGFYQQLPQFQNVPAYIVTESYGGKMGAEFALVWHQAEKAGSMRSNLKGVALGDAWISPIDSVMTWAPFLLNTGMIDNEGFQRIDAGARMTREKVQTNQWQLATRYWAYTQSIVLKNTHGIDFYNILTKIRRSRSYHLPPQDVLSYNAEAIYRRFVKPQQLSLDRLMNGPVREALGLQQLHGVQSAAVFDKLAGDFMKPVISEVERLLEETDLRVFVYNGHLDLIVDTPGTLLWVEKLKWMNADKWKNSPRHPLLAGDVVEGFVKSYGNLGVYWVNRAGHMVPKDNPEATELILQDLTSNANKNEGLLQVERRTRT